MARNLINSQSQSSSRVHSRSSSISSLKSFESKESVSQNQSEVEENTSSLVDDSDGFSVINWISKDLGNDWKDYEKLVESLCLEIERLKKEQEELVAKNQELAKERKNSPVAETPKSTTPDQKSKSPAPANKKLSKFMGSTASSSGKSSKVNKNRINTNSRKPVETEKEKKLAPVVNKKERKINELEEQIKIYTGKIDSLEAELKKTKEEGLDNETRTELEVEIADLKARINELSFNLSKAESELWEREQTDLIKQSTNNKKQITQLGEENERTIHRLKDEIYSKGQKITSLEKELATLHELVKIDSDQQENKDWVKESSDAFEKFETVSELYDKQAELEDKIMELEKELVEKGSALEKSAELEGKRCKVEEFEEHQKLTEELVISQRKNESLVEEKREIGRLNEGLMRANAKHSTTQSDFLKAALDLKNTREKATRLENLLAYDQQVFKEELNSQLNKNQDLENQLVVANGDLANKDNKITEQAGKLENQETENKKLVQQIDQQKSNLTGLQKKWETTQDNLKAAESNLTTRTAELDKQKEINATQTDQLATIQATNKGLADQVANLNSKIDDLKKKNDDLTTKNNDQSSAINRWENTFSSAKKTYSEEVAELRKKNETLAIKAEIYRGQADQSQVSAENANEETQKRGEEIVKIEGEKEKIEEQIKNKENERLELQGKNEELKSKLKKTENTLAEVSSIKNEYYLLARLLESKGLIIPSTNDKGQTTYPFFRVGENSFSENLDNLIRQEAIIIEQRKQIKNFIDEQKVLKTNNDTLLNRQSGLTQELEKIEAELRKQKETATQREQQLIEKNSILNLENADLSCYLSRLDDVLLERNTQLNRTFQAQDKLEKERNELKNLNQTLKTRLTKKNKELNNLDKQWEKENDEWKEEVKELKDELGALKTKLKKDKTKNQKLTTDNEALDKKVGELEWLCDNRLEKKNRLLKKLQEIRAQQEIDAQNAKNKHVCQTLINWQNIPNHFERNSVLKKSITSTHDNFIDTIATTQKHLGIKDLTQITTSHKLPKGKNLGDLIIFYEENKDKNPTSPSQPQIIIKSELEETNETVIVNQIIQECDLGLSENSSLTQVIDQINKLIKPKPTIIQPVSQPNDTPFGEDLVVIKQLELTSLTELFGVAFDSAIKQQIQEAINYSQVVQARQAFLAKHLTPQSNSTANSLIPEPKPFWPPERIFWLILLTVSLLTIGGLLVKIKGIRNKKVK